MMLIDDTKIVEIFCQVDDFCICFKQWMHQKSLSAGKVPTKVGRPARLSESEIITILILYQLSGMKNFQYFYQKTAPALLTYFPKLVSYNRFVELISAQLPLMWMFCLYQCSQSQRSGSYFVDSKKLPVCHNRRIHSHKVFEGFAGRGKSSTGWFYGLKLHLIINHKGEVINFLFTSANKADNNEQVLTYLFAGLQGSCYGDKGYLTKLFEEFYNKGFRLITKVRNNMKKLPCLLKDALLLRKRGLIESVNDILMSVFDLEHTRHRKAENAFTHMLASLAAYGFMERKPSLEKAMARIA
jgi:hypothetical protein